MSRKIMLFAGLLLASASASTTTTSSFALFGDYGDGPYAKPVATMVKSLSPTVIVTAGDNCYGSSPTISTQVGDKYGTYVSGGKVFPSLGNHDWKDACAGLNKYLAYFKTPGNGRYYVRQVGDIAFFMINSNTEEPDGTSSTSKQALWLKQQLSSVAARYKIVVFHHPAYSSGQHGPSLYMRWPFEQWGASAVFFGHDHDYERFMLDNNKDGKKIPYVVVGTGGQSTRPFSTIQPGSVFHSDSNGAIHCKDQSNGLGCGFRDTNGHILDSFIVTP